MKCIIGSTEEVFFDSVNQLQDEYDSEMGLLSYEFWMNEPISVQERRHNFLQEMGFSGSESEESEEEENEVLERMVEGNEAVSSSSSSSNSIFSEEEEEGEVFSSRECNGNNGELDASDELSSSLKEYNSVNKKLRQWWKKKKKKMMMMKQRESSINEEFKRFEMRRIKVEVNKKKVKEVSALLNAQEIEAHKGVIWTMKFSPNGEYLATGGEDGVVRVWRIECVDSSLERLPCEEDEKKRFGREKKVKVTSLIPNKMFKIQVFPMQEFHGHDGDVLDLSWSNSNFLLSSSMDKTVRLWELGSNACVNTFHHNDYVTCVQFNPTDNRYFISGSIDGKVRIWGVSEKRVLDWADIRDAVTAACYQPNGQGFVVGSLNGNCRFYEAKGKFFELSADILLHSSKRSSSNRITGIKFSPEDPQKVMIMSDNSKLRVLDKTDVVSKFRGLTKSGSQMSASFTSNGRHIISIGHDSNVYIWNHDKQIQLPSTQTKSVRSCEHFYSEGVTVVVPWCGTETEVGKVYNVGHDTSNIARNPSGFSLSNMFGPKSSTIWPEEQCQKPNNGSTWGLVIVTANRDGMIKTFHNYGLPVRV